MDKEEVIEALTLLIIEGFSTIFVRKHGTGSKQWYVINYAGNKGPMTESSSLEQIQKNLNQDI